MCHRHAPRPQDPPQLARGHRQIQVMQDRISKDRIKRPVAERQPMAGWMKNGVPRLAMDDHLKERLLKKDTATTVPAPAEAIKK